MDRIGFKFLLLLFYIVIGFLVYFLVITIIEDYHDKHPKVPETQITEQTNEEEQNSGLDENGKILSSEEKARGFVDRTIEKIKDFFSGRSANDEREETQNLNQKTFFEKYYDNVVEFFTGKKNDEENPKNIEETIEETN